MILLMIGIVIVTVLDVIGLIWIATHDDEQR